MFFIIKSFYDDIYDILFFRVIKDYNYKESIELNAETILDLDENNIPVALEILNASEVFNNPKEWIKEEANISSI